MSPAQERIKKCSRCKKNKRIGSFPKRTDNKSGRRTICKSCTNIGLKEWRKTHTEPVHKRLVTARKKRCGGCGELKFLKYFAEEKFGIYGRKSQCKECRKWQDVLNKYDLTKDQWQKMFLDQGSVCAICHNQKTDKSHWATDHDHATGKVRGILCHHCNQALGIFKDSSVYLQNAIDYLNRN